MTRKNLINVAVEMLSNFKGNAPCHACIINGEVQLHAGFAGNCCCDDHGGVRMDMSDLRDDDDYGAWYDMI